MNDGDDNEKSVDKLSIDENEQSNDMIVDKTKLQIQMPIEYEEYENDVDEGYYNDGTFVTAGWLENGTDWEEGVRQANANDENDSDEYDDKESDCFFEDVKDNPAFVHLTTRLSFSEAHAARACRAIQDWDILTTNNGNTSSGSSNNKHEDKISLAMDWLCLHLTEQELTKGFQHNKTRNMQQSKSMLSKTGIPLVGSGLTKPIPHPSISVAKSITSDKEWSKMVRQEERISGFVRLGFHPSEAEMACEATSEMNEQNVLQPQQDPALFHLISGLNGTTAASFTVGDTLDLNETDLVYAAEERAHERQALVAIYDDQFRTEPPLWNLEHYVLSITPFEVLQEPAKSEDCRLDVFVPRGYPVVQTPLALFNNSNFPPTLLRRINEELALKVRGTVGSPIVFELVTFLSENLSPLQMDFIREQRSKEFEAEQLRLRHAAGHEIVGDELDGKLLGKRQRAKIKAAEKAYNRPEEIEKQNEERLRRQEERSARIREETSRIRLTMAERAIAKRQEERIEQDAERAFRAAMNAAFNRGESAEEARESAHAARIKTLREHGVVINSQNSEEEKVEGGGEGGEKNIEEPMVVRSCAETRTAGPTQKSVDFVNRRQEASNGSGSIKEPQATPTTAAFMDRLRQMYENAAKLKAKGNCEIMDATSQFTRKSLIQYQLKEAEPSASLEREEFSDRKIPRPVAVPTGELAEVMNDVIIQQQEQPWLVFPEARVPTVAAERSTLSIENRRTQHEINQNLRRELERKRKAAQDWASKHADAGSRRNYRANGFSAQQFHYMMSVRQR